MASFAGTSTRRSKGVTVHRPIVYGSSARPITKKDVPSDPSHTHAWTLFVRGVHGEDISYFIKKVVFKLHESFPNPLRGNLPSARRMGPPVLRCLAARMRRLDSGRCATV